jgi:hypothetical protein
MENNVKRLLVYLSWMLIASSSLAQSKTYTTVTIRKISGTRLTFTKKWAYPWNIIKVKDDKFEDIESGKTIKSEVAHLYLTADCQTDVQGGYSVRYCYASKYKDTIRLNFADGLPAYANEFNIYIENGRFYFEPKIIYPQLIPNEKLIYHPISSKLILDQNNYKTAKMITGYINAVFEEITYSSTKKQAAKKYYFRGYFKAPVK